LSESQNVCVDWVVVQETIFRLKTVGITIADALIEAFVYDEKVVCY